MFEDIRDKVSPMMQHYLDTKEKYPDCILFYRLGDFYEMFFEDAEIASKELELTLTGKSCGLPERAPMCGVPFHAVDNYLNRLVSKGYKAAICEQLEDPKKARGIVKRDVIRIVTPGTNIDVQSMEEGENNYLMAIALKGGRFGLCISDVTTGDFSVTELGTLNRVTDELAKFSPKEIICNQAFLSSGIDAEDLRSRQGIIINALDSRYFEENHAAGKLLTHFKAGNLEGLGLSDFSSAILAAGAAITYLEENQKQALSNIISLKPYLTSSYMIIDSASRRNLELTETLREKRKKGSLLWVLDRTRTAMGARKLRSIIEEPLIDEHEINARLDAVEEFSSRVMDRDEIREYLGTVYDLERILCKIIYGSANPRDLIAFKNSISILPPIRRLLSEFESPIIRELSEKMDALQDIHELLEASIIEDAPLSQHDGGIIKDGYNSEVDELKSARINGKKWLTDLEEREKERTGIKNLRIKFNKVFGYSIEVTNSNLSQVPPEYVRKQTLTGGERFITDELKKMEDTILNSEERLTTLEFDIFTDIKRQIAAESKRIIDTAKAVGMIDVLQTFSYVSEHNSYVKPHINTEGRIEVREGRHPVVEKMLPGGSFVPNDIFLNNNKDMISIITGPNMAGKSTYMRQCAIISLMAAIGCFVPAAEADICIVDRIFTRVGALDDLAGGQSTFMVEMTEVANILRNATSRSLLILDEIGRGTSTFDGLSIAWAVVEHIANKRLIGAKTLFATHYHELTELEGKIPCVNNFCFAVKEEGEDVVFLRRIVPGGADKSYGIHVASLAGVPDPVIKRANEILSELLDNDITTNLREIAKESAASLKTQKKSVKKDEVDLGQLSFKDTKSEEEVLKELSTMDITRMTPMDALNTLFRLQNELNNRL